MPGILAALSLCLPRACLQMGFPIMIKATAGGGGKGMRLAHKPEDFLYLLRQAQQEAESAFSNKNVYLERYIQNPRHIEFQACRHSESFGHALWEPWQALNTKLW